MRKTMLATALLGALVMGSAGLAPQRPAATPPQQAAQRLTLLHEQQMQRIQHDIAR